MQKTEYSRKVDANGRIIIPAQLREALDVRAGDTHDFYIHEEDGRKFLCIECFRLESEIEKAKRILAEAGLL